ncbi:MAG: hypothetical protein A2Y17_08615 [Clostridiales bacterium GWF2_38_85]|nr:MAG: hypothetical protein A2Y17_08615 [Clostridiales bacterium GWF2_38_85]HBL83743.1 hypothetical protein [Clostridiales bacterium]
MRLSNALNLKVLAVAAILFISTTSMSYIEPEAVKLPDKCIITDGKLNMDEPKKVEQYDSLLQSYEDSIISPIPKVDVSEVTDTSINQTPETEEDVESKTNDESEIVEDKRVIYLTFDDGPSLKYTEQILDILAAHDVKATFFVIGDWATYYPNIIKRIYNEGHALGCHSMIHKTYDIYKSVDAFEADLKCWESKIKEILCELPDYKLYRFPGGSSTANIYGTRDDCIAMLEDSGYLIFDWTAANCDRWKDNKNEGESTDAYLRRMLFKTIRMCEQNEEQPRIVLMHDTSGSTLAMLDWAIGELQNQGYTFDVLANMSSSYMS